MIVGVVVVTVVDGGGGAPGVVVVGGGFPFVVVGPVVAAVDTRTVGVDVVRCRRVDVASARVGTAGADECEPAMTTAAKSPPATSSVPARA